MLERLSIRFRLMLDFLRRRPTCSAPPPEWMIETTNRCNLACPMCTRSSVKFRLADMPPQLFKHLLLEHPQLEAVWPYGFGEPLLHPHIFDLIRTAKELGITVSLSTNATLLTAERSIALLDCKPDYLILAIDAAREETYSVNRSPARFHQTEHNVDEFLRMKVIRGVAVHVTVQMVVLQNNSAEMSAFLRRWKRPGVDIVRLRSDLSHAGLSGSPARGSSQKTGRPCFFLWRGPMFIQAAGTVIPCPYYHGARPFGDVRSVTPLAAWNSEQMQSLRKAHVRGDLSAYPVCATCRRHQPHPLLTLLSFFVTTHHVRKHLPYLERFQLRLGATLFE